jgi:hypothetical protein
MTIEQHIAIAYKIGAILFKPSNQDKDTLEFDGKEYPREDLIKYHEYIIGKLKGYVIPDPYLSSLHYDIYKRKRITRKEYQRQYHRDYRRFGCGSQKDWGIQDKIPRKPRKKTKHSKQLKILNDETLSKQPMI